MELNTSLHWIDYTIIILSVLAAVGVGVYFSKKQNSTQAYFAANGAVPTWAIGMSMFATIISSVTFLAYPGAAYGGNWILLVQGLMVPVVLVFVIGYIVPLYRKMIRLSCYEYFERRFGSLARYYSSVAFILEHFAKSGTIMFLMGTAVAIFTGHNDPTTIAWIIIFVGVVVIALTYLGGMEAIIWMDVAQGFLLIIGGLMAIGLLFYLTDGGPSEIFAIAAEHQKIDVGPYDWDLCQRTFWVLAINGIFYAT